MAKGTQTFDFEFMLMDVIPVNVHVIVRFGEVQSVYPTYNAKPLAIEEYCYDDMNDYITVEEYLMELAQELYDQPEDEVILELE